MLTSVLLASTAAATTIVTFDGNKETTHLFTMLNDPVMGGESKGTWQVNQTGAYGVMAGQVVNVPSLEAPGFIKAVSDGSFPDISADIQGALVLKVRSNTPEYTGFRVTFAAGTTSPSYACSGGGQIPYSRGCFKARFEVPASDDFVDVRIPFDSFSDLWSPATGDLIKTCQEDSSACVTPKLLAKILRFEVWGEGVAGQVQLEVQSISSAPSPSVLGDRPPAEYDSCNAAVQDNLRFNISSRTTADGVPIIVDEGESLATAVCCDKRLAYFAEPQFLYQAPDINFYNYLAVGLNTFYDSVCGIPVFQAPVNRTMKDFIADTDEHGWPSFRAEEVITENVVTMKEAPFYVTSVCGTHLGTYLPDEEGERWCIDLSCIAGHATS